MKLKQSLKERFQRSNFSWKLCNIARNQICVLTPPPAVYSLNFQRQYRSHSFCNNSEPRFNLEDSFIKFDECHNRSSLDSGNSSGSSRSRRGLSPITHSHVKGKCIVNPNIYNELVYREEPKICRSISDCGEALQTVTVAYPRHNCDFDLVELDDFEDSNADWESELNSNDEEDPELAVTANGDVTDNSDNCGALLDYCEGRATIDSYASSVENAATDTLMNTQLGADGCSSDEGCGSGLSGDSFKEYNHAPSLTNADEIDGENQPIIAKMRNFDSTVKFSNGASPTVKGRRALRYEALGIVFENVENHCIDDCYDNNDSQLYSNDNNVQEENQDLPTNDDSNVDCMEGNEVKEFVECCNRDVSCVNKSEIIATLPYVPNTNKIGGTRENCINVTNVHMNTVLDNNTFSGSIHRDDKSRNIKKYSNINCTKRDNEDNVSDVESETSSFCGWRRRQEFVLFRARKRSIRRSGIARGTIPRLSYSRKLSKNLASLALLAASPENGSIIDPSEWSDSDKMSFGWSCEDSASHSRTSSYNDLSTDNEGGMYEEPNDADCSEVSHDSSCIPSKCSSNEELVIEGEENNLIDELEIGEETREYKHFQNKSTYDSDMSNNNCIMSSDMNTNDQRMCSPEFCVAGTMCCGSGCGGESGVVTATCCRRRSQEQSSPVAACEPRGDDHVSYCASTAVLLHTQDTRHNQGIQCCCCCANSATNMPCRSSSIPVYQKRGSSNVVTKREESDSKVECINSKYSLSNTTKSMFNKSNKISIKKETIIRNRPGSFRNSSVPNLGDRKVVSAVSSCTGTLTSSSSVSSRPSSRTRHADHSTSSPAPAEGDKPTSVSVSLSSMRSAETSCGVVKEGISPRHSHVTKISNSKIQTPSRLGNFSQSSHIAQTKINSIKTNTTLQKQANGNKDERNRNIQLSKLKEQMVSSEKIEESSDIRSSLGSNRIKLLSKNLINVRTSVSPSPLSRQNIARSSTRSSAQMSTKVEASLSQETLDKISQRGSGTFSRISSSSSLEGSSRGQIVNRVMTGNRSSRYKGNSNQAKGTPSSVRQQFYQSKSKNHNKSSLSAKSSLLGGSTNSFRTDSPLNSEGNTPVCGSLQSLEGNSDICLNIPEVIGKNLDSSDISVNNRNLNLDIRNASKGPANSTTKTNDLLKKIAIDKVSTRSSYKSSKKSYVLIKDEIKDTKQKQRQTISSNHTLPRSQPSKQTDDNFSCENNIISKFSDDRLNSLSKTTNFGRCKSTRNTTNFKRTSSLQMSKNVINSTDKTKSRLFVSNQDSTSDCQPTLQRTQVPNKLNNNATNGDDSKIVRASNNISLSSVQSTSNSKLLGSTKEIHRKKADCSKQRKVICSSSRVITDACKRNGDNFASRTDNLSAPVHKSIPEVAGPGDGKCLPIVDGGSAEENRSRNELVASKKETREKVNSIPQSRLTPGISVSFRSTTTKSSVLPQKRENTNQRSFRVRNDKGSIIRKKLNAPKDSENIENITSVSNGFAGEQHSHSNQENSETGCVSNIETSGISLEASSATSSNIAQIEKSESNIQKDVCFSDKMPADESIRTASAHHTDDLQLAVPIITDVISTQITNDKGIEVETPKVMNDRAKNNTIIHVTGDDECNIQDGRVIVRVSSEPFITVNNSDNNNRLSMCLSSNNDVNIDVERTKETGLKRSKVKSLDTSGPVLTGHFESIISTLQKATSTLENDSPQSSNRQDNFHSIHSGSEGPPAINKIVLYTQGASQHSYSKFPRARTRSLPRDDMSDVFPHDLMLQSTGSEDTLENCSMAATRTIMNGERTCHSSCSNCCSGHARILINDGARQALVENRLKKNLSKSRELLSQLEMEHRRLKGDDESEHFDNFTSTVPSIQHDLEQLLESLSKETALIDNYDDDLIYSSRNESFNLKQEQTHVNWRPPKSDNRFCIDTRVKKPSSDGRHLFAFLQKKNKNSTSSRHGMSRHSCNDDIRPSRGRSTSPASRDSVTKERPQYVGPTAQQRSLSLPKTFLADKYGLAGFKAAIPR